MNFIIHWDKHANEFPELKSPNDYYRAIYSFIENPPKGTLTSIRSNGDTLFYNPTSNTFAIKSADGSPRTMFKPKDQMKYWLNQIQGVVK